MSPRREIRQTRTSLLEQLLLFVAEVEEQTDAGRDEEGRRCRREDLFRAACQYVASRRQARPMQKGRTPTVDLSRVPDDVWCDGFSCEYVRRGGVRPATAHARVQGDGPGNA